VDPIGFDKADQITYLAENNLNAKCYFLNEMLYFSSSIVIVVLLMKKSLQMLAVDIGASYVPGEPDS
jgi:hypothetical protein